MVFAAVDALSLLFRFGVAAIAVEFTFAVAGTERGKGGCDNDRRGECEDAVDGSDGACAISSPPAMMKQIKGRLLAVCPSKGLELDDIAYHLASCDPGWT